MADNPTTRFILGSAEQDTSAALRKAVIESADKGEKIIMIVPDQFEYETELALFRECKGLGKTTLIPKIRVRTFDKLADDIISVYKSALEPADETTKTIYMYRAVRACAEAEDDSPLALTAFKKAAEKPGFAAKLLQTVAMLKSANLSPEIYVERLKVHSQDFLDSNVVLYNKLNDLAKIYGEYNSYFTDRHTDRLDSVSAAASLAAVNRYFGGYSVFVDGFTGFTASQHSFIESVISAADNSVFAFVSEYNSERVVFKAVNEEIAKIEAYARQCDNDIVGLNDVLTGFERIKSDEIKQMSRSLYERSASCKSYGDINIIAADSVYSELDYVAAEIKRLITEEGYRCREIAVVTPSPAEYKTPLESVFEKYDIKLFSDIPNTILHLPLVNLTIKLLDLMCGFNTDNLLSYIKTGFVQIPDSNDTHCIRFDEINSFEEYILHWNVRASELKSPFPANTHETTAEKVRAAAVDSLIKLYDRLTEADSSGSKRRTGSEITKAVADYLLNEVKIEKSIAARCKTPGSESLTDTDSEIIASYQMLWNKLLEIFEALYKGLGDCRMSMKQYRDLFREICTRTMLAKPPQVRDAVLAGDITRTRTIGIRAVFIVGASLGTFPNESAPSGIFSEFETELLNENEFPISKKRENIYYSSRYEVYRALTLASDRLYLSCPSMDSGCTKLTPCEPLTTIAKLCKIDTVKAEDLSDEFYCRSIRAAEQRYAAICRKQSQSSCDLRHALIAAGCADFTKRLDDIAENLSSDGRNEVDPKYIDRVLLNTISATNVEKAIQCPLRYYLDKGLHITGRDIVEYNPINVGNAVHFVMQSVLEAYKGNDAAFLALSQEQLYDKALEHLNKYLEVKLGGDFGKDNRFKFLYNNLTNGASELLWVHQREFENRFYRPVMFEKKLDGDKTAPINTAPLKITAGGRQLTIGGIIDRVDTFTFSASNSYDQYANEPDSEELKELKAASEKRLSFCENNKYIRVVDYKTGSTSFDLADALNGINIQMLLYLFALKDANPNYKAGAVTYCPSAASGSKDKQFTSSAPIKLEKHLQSGLYFLDAASENELLKYANGIAALAENAFSPEKAMANGVENHLRPAADYPVIKDAVLSVVSDTLGEIYNGKIRANPTMSANKNEDTGSPCNYCVYAPICRRKDCVTKSDPNKYNELFPETTDTNSAAAEEQNNNEESDNG